MSRQRYSAYHDPRYAGVMPKSETSAESNPVSLEVRRVLQATGKSLRQLEKETGISYAVLSRLQSPSYSGHTLESLRALGKALGLRPVVTFTAE